MTSGDVVWGAAFGRRVMATATTIATTRTAPPPIPTHRAQLTPFFLGAWAMRRLSVRVGPDPRSDAGTWPSAEAGSHTAAHKTRKGRHTRNARRNHGIGTAIAFSMGFIMEAGEDGEGGTRYGGFQVTSIPRNGYSLSS